MRAYSIFDDFPQDAVQTLEAAGVAVTVHPLGVPRPDRDQMKAILETYDCMIIGTSQKITEDMFENISSPRIIASASVGLDHIQIPVEKRNLVTVLNTPKANAQSVAEFTFGCALACVKRLNEGNTLYEAGKNNKALRRKPEDLAGKTIGVVGAGNISVRVMEFARFFGMDVLCWTRNPDAHADLPEKGVRFTNLETLCHIADVISVNLPNTEGTAGLISADLIAKMKETAVFISVSRRRTVDVEALLHKAAEHPNFYVCLDLDVDPELTASLSPRDNVLVTPHIAGGTVETRKRMFRELANAIVESIQRQNR